MSKISDNIRAAALGPTPSDIESLTRWISGDSAWDRAAQFCSHGDFSKSFLHGADEAQARTFLLLVAEATA